MRGLRSFLGLFVVLIALGAYLYFVESKRTPGETEARDKVFTVEADAIEEISVKAESGERTTLRKSGTDWQIVSPVTAEPDDTEVSGLTSNLSRLEIQRVIDENAADLKEYGLDAPRVEVSFKAGGQQHTLHIGSKTPPGTDLYARAGDSKKVFLVASYLDATFNRTTFNLRDKAALKVDRDKADALEVVTAGRQLRFTKSDGEWRLASPAAGRADYSAVDGLVGRLASAQMKSLAAAEPADLKEFGLDAPEATVRIGTGSSQAAILFGKKTEAGDVYAKDASRPAVFTLEASLLEDLKKDVGEFRQKDLFDARAFNTTRLEITRGGATLAFEKTTVKDKDGKEQEKWRQVLPAARDVDTAKVESLISAISAARADSFVERAPALDKPELSVAIKFDEGRKEERVAFARSGQDAFASRGGEAGAAKIPASTLDAIVKALDEIK